MKIDSMSATTLLHQIRDRLRVFCCMINSEETRAVDGIVGLLKEVRDDDTFASLVRLVLRHVIISVNSEEDYSRVSAKIREAVK